MQVGKCSGQIKGGGAAGKVRRCLRQDGFGELAGHRRVTAQLPEDIEGHRQPHPKLGIGLLTPGKGCADVIVKSLKAVQPLSQVARPARFGNPDQIGSQPGLDGIELAGLLELLAAITPNRLQAAIACGIPPDHRFVDQSPEEVEDGIGF